MATERQEGHRGEERQAEGQAETVSRSGGAWLPESGLLVGTMVGVQGGPTTHSYVPPQGALRPATAPVHGRVHGGVDSLGKRSQPGTIKVLLHQHEHNR